MIKFDIINSIYILLIVSFFMVAFSCIRCTIKEFKNKLFGCKSIKNNAITIIGYLRKLVIKDYLSYEKYEIWRFCVEK
ncbi:hypothetical protein [Clostridium ganghwense]|uniref:Uncharacterized protein n=1 Tax=Clostridium ganghwense TaxID=312089 RepID=A0ABT4CRS7_9CLOT|nr:hypothetical protein [Clostridium ganghwense]MCY6370786.1 hypothetical protein [Clostridium ganghwense]